MPHPKVKIHEVTRFKISSVPGNDVSYVKFSFDRPVVEYSVNVLGTSHNTGIIAGRGRKTVDQYKDKTLDELSERVLVEELYNFIINNIQEQTLKEFYERTVDEIATYRKDEIIVEEVDYTEVYQEGVNRVNLYGKSKEGIWTLYMD